jgi:hypothetical protein
MQATTKTCHCTVMSVFFRGLKNRTRKKPAEGSRQSDSNRRPAVYKTAALPLSYAGMNEYPLTLDWNGQAEVQRKFLQRSFTPASECWEFCRTGHCVSKEAAKAQWQELRSKDRLLGLACRLFSSGRKAQYSGGSWFHCCAPPGHPAAGEVRRGYAPRRPRV